MVSAMLIKKNNQGFLLVEALIGASIVAVVVVAVLLSFSSGLRLSSRNGLATRAQFLVEEGIEAARIMRDKGWTGNFGALTNETAYHLVFSNNTWATTTSNALIDSRFDRTITVSSVYRDSNNDIASSGTVDSNTKKVTIAVSWRNGSATTTKSLQAYLTNIFND